MSLTEILKSLPTLSFTEREQLSESLWKLEKDTTVENVLKSADSNFQLLDSLEAENGEEN